MIRGPWIATPTLRFVERMVAVPIQEGHVRDSRLVRILQQRWEREATHYRVVDGRRRRWSGMEHEWRDVIVEEETCERQDG